MNVFQTMTVRKFIKWASVCVSIPWILSLGFFYSTMAFAIRACGGGKGTLYAGVLYSFVSYGLFICLAVPLDLFVIIVGTKVLKKDTGQHHTRGWQFWFGAFLILVASVTLLVVIWLVYCVLILPLVISR